MKGLNVNEPHCYNSRFIFDNWTVCSLFFESPVQDPTDFQAAYDEFVEYTLSPANWNQIKDELTERGVRSNLYSCPQPYETPYRVGICGHDRQQMTCRNLCSERPHLSAHWSLTDSFSHMFALLANVLN